jgi:nucleoside-diphosphate-sugar epimerase
MTVVAVHQPNFLPRLGFFEKADRADEFVLLDPVQFPRRSATTRVGIFGSAIATCSQYTDARPRRVLVSRRAADIRRAAEVPGWVPRVELKEGLSEIVRFAHDGTAVRIERHES